MSAGIGHIVSEVDALTSLLRAVPENHGDELMESLKFKKYPYGLGVMTVATSVSGHFDAFEVHDMLEQQKPDLLPEKEFALAIADCRCRCSSTQKHADCGERERKRALEPIRRTFLDASGSRPLREHKLLKRSRNMNVVTGFLLCDTRLTAIIKFFVQHSRTFESNYDPSFDEPRISSICKDLIICGFVRGDVETTRRRYVLVTRLMRRYLETLKLVDKVDDRSNTADSAAAKG